MEPLEQHVKVQNKERERKTLTDVRSKWGRKKSDGAAQEGDEQGTERKSSNYHIAVEENRSKNQSRLGITRHRDSSIDKHAQLEGQNTGESSLTYSFQRKNRSLNRREPGGRQKSQRENTQLRGKRCDRQGKRGRTPTYNPTSSTNKNS